MRPEDISNLIRLPNEATGPMRGLVAEHGAVDPSPVPAVVDELSPSEHGVGSLGSQDDLLSGADKLPGAGLRVDCLSNAARRGERQSKSPLSRQPPKRLHIPRITIDAKITRPIATKAPRSAHPSIAWSWLFTLERFAERIDILIQLFLSSHAWTVFRATSR